MTLSFVRHILKSAIEIISLTRFMMSLAVITLPLSAYAQSQVSTIKPLLVAAIDAGRAEGILVGAAADAIASQFGSREPIRISVRIVKPLTDTDCRRLEVKTSQKGVVQQGKPAAPMSFTYEINFCRDGRFPEDRLAPQSSAQGR
jgi:hypothetical protein